MVSAAFDTRSQQKMLPNLNDQRAHRNMHIHFVVSRQLQLAPVGLNLKHVAFDLLLKHSFHPVRLPLVLFKRLAALGLPSALQQASDHHATRNAPAEEPRRRGRGTCLPDTLLTPRHCCAKWWGQLKDSGASVSRLR